jgi:rubrerythrin
MVHFDRRNGILICADAAEAAPYMALTREMERAETWLEYRALAEQYWAMLDRSSRLSTQEEKPGGWRCPDCGEHYVNHGIDKPSGKPICPPKEPTSPPGEAAKGALRLPG